MYNIEDDEHAVTDGRACITVQTAREMCAWLGDDADAFATVSAFLRLHSPDTAAHIERAGRAFRRRVERSN